MAAAFRCDAVLVLAMLVGDAGLRDLVGLPDWNAPHPTYRPDRRQDRGRADRSGDWRRHRLD